MAPTSLIQALDQGIAEIGKMIEALRSGFEAYRGERRGRVVATPSSDVSAG